jgi:Ca-activated chloride channel family protein
LLEVAVPPTRAGTSKSFAKVDVAYDNMHTEKRARLSDGVKVSFTDSRKEVAKKQKRKVMIAAVEAVATEQNRVAVALRDQGKIKEAEKVLKGNAAYLKKEGKRLRSRRLNDYALDNESDASNLAPDRWNRQRKTMREGQYKNASQRAW